MKRIKAMGTSLSRWLAKVKAGIRVRNKKRRFITADVVNVEMCRMLGEEPSKVNSIAIVMEAGNVASIYITRYLTQEEKGKVIVALKKFHIMPAPVGKEHVQAQTVNRGTYNPEKASRPGDNTIPPVK